MVVPSRADLAAWREDFIKATKGISSDISYQESAEILRQLILSKRLMFTDMRDNPAKFFEAHRLLLAPDTRGTAVHCSLLPKWFGL